MYLEMKTLELLRHEWDVELVAVCVVLPNHGETTPLEVFEDAAAKTEANEFCLRCNGI